MPPIASTRSGKFSKFTSTTWLTSTPRYERTVSTASCAPPNAYAALILLRPRPGISTTVSRGMLSRDEAPPPTRMSRIESARLGPPDPGSLVFAVRRSEPSTRTFVADVRGKPPGSSPPPTSSWWIVADTRNTTSDSASQPTSASSSHLAARPGPTRPRPGSRRPRPGAGAGPGPGPPGGRRRAPSSRPRPRPRRAGRARYFV